jgi:hypothetical protein
MFRSIAAVATAAVASFGIALAGTSTAQAAPSDYQFPLPVAGITADPPFMFATTVHGWLSARTDPATPGVTRFVAGEPIWGCYCSVQWRNLTTGATGITDIRLGGDRVPLNGYTNTGSGVLVATVGLTGGAMSTTLIQSAGMWTVP